MSCRNAYPGVLQKVNEVTANFQALGPAADIDINNVAMRFALDVTGLVGFGKDYQTCKNFGDAATDDLFDVLRQCELA